jgi:hypothetical protein
MEWKPSLAANEPGGWLALAGDQEMKSQTCDERIQLPMETTLPVEVRFRRTSVLHTGIGWGLLGGLVATLVMDLALMGALSAMAEQPLYCFSTVGDTVMLFFMILGIRMDGGIPLGIATHYTVGPVVGAIFGVAVSQIESLQRMTKSKLIVLAIVYVEILSQPMLAMTPVLLKTTASETVFWYVGSSVMHLICGIVLGLVVSYWLQIGTTDKHR